MAPNLSMDGFGTIHKSIRLPWQVPREVDTREFLLFGGCIHVERRHGDGNGERSFASAIGAVSWEERDVEGNQERNEEMDDVHGET